jgi:hypothetical protein
MNGGDAPLLSASLDSDGSSAGNLPAQAVQVMEYYAPVFGAVALPVIMK